MFSVKPCRRGGYGFINAPKKTNSLQKAFGYEGRIPNGGGINAVRYFFGSVSWSQAVETTMMSPCQITANRIGSPEDGLRRKPADLTCFVSRWAGLNCLFIRPTSEARFMNIRPSWLRRVTTGLCQRPGFGWGVFEKSLRQEVSRPRVILNSELLAFILFPAGLFKAFHSIKLLQERVLRIILVLWLVLRKRKCCQKNRRTNQSSSGGSFRSYARN